jgi:hypothetical protein
MKRPTQRAISALAASLFFAGMAIAQDLPAEVLLLSRVKRHIREELQNLPNISCLETVRREFQPTNSRMRPLDTIRLEVLTNGDKELFASPGDRKFSERHPIGYAGSGVLGNGLFGLYLKDVLLNASASDTYKGEEEIGGRRLARFDYRLPAVWAGQVINLPEGSGRVGLRGSYWADPETLDVLRLELNAYDIPLSLPITEAVTSIDYAPTDLGNNLVVLLPRSADFLLGKLSGEVNHNRIEFTGCRVFQAQSTIDFAAPDSVQEPPHFGTSSVDDTLRPLPAGLRITVKLRNRITAAMAVGSLIEGVVDGNVRANGAVVIASGSPVRGRIRRLERYTDPSPHFVVGLEFTEVELQGVRHRFYASLVKIESTPGVEKTYVAKDQTDVLGVGSGINSVSHSMQTLQLPTLPQVATFFFRGAALNLPRSFRTVWQTLQPPP